MMRVYDVKGRFEGVYDDVKCPICNGQHLRIFYDDPTDDNRYVKCPDCGLIGANAFNSSNVVGDVQACENFKKGLYSNYGDTLAKYNKEHGIEEPVAETVVWSNGVHVVLGNKKVMNGEEEKISKCPYCLNDRVVVLVRDWRKYNGKEYGRFYCYCYKCKSRGPIMDSRKTAIAQFNKPFPLDDVRGRYAI